MTVNVRGALGSTAVTVDVRGALGFFAGCCWRSANRPAAMANDSPSRPARTTRVIILSSSSLDFWEEEAAEPAESCDKCVNYFKITPLALVVGGAASDSGRLSKDGGKHGRGGEEDHGGREPPRRSIGRKIVPVSYTHLTLPTICSV